MIYAVFDPSLLALWTNSCFFYIFMSHMIGQIHLPFQLYAGSEYLMWLFRGWRTLWREWKQTRHQWRWFIAVFDRYYRAASVSYCIHNN